MKPVAKILCLVLFISCFGVAGSHAGWIENGVPLTHQWGAAEGGVIAPDGSSGAIIALRACYEGRGHIIAQHLNSLGVVLWGEKGVEVCTASGDQDSPVIVTEGGGDAIIAWIDYRNGNRDIYAQRVNASGAVQWTTDGVAICTATGHQYYPTIISDGAGGAIVTWQDYRGGNADIYVQSVNASGAVRWATDGVALCTATGDQESPQITSDSAGGAIVTWQDARSGIGDIYAQRINASGAVQWTTDGVALGTTEGYQLHPTIVSDGAGGAIVTWYDNGYDIYAQRVDASGALQWTADGLALCRDAGFQWFPEIVSDGAGGAIVAWHDHRSGNDDIYAQRVNASGAVQWMANGIALCTATGDKGMPLVISDSTGGAIVAWEDYRNGNLDIYAQRVNASGAVQWTTDGVSACAAAGDQYMGGITFDGAGGAIVTWASLGDFRVSAQRVNGSGVVQWTADGVTICKVAGDQEDPVIISDDEGGAIVTWQDYRSGNYDIYAQRVDASGAVQWLADGVPLCTATRDQESPRVSSDGAGGAIIAWQDYRSGERDIYAQRVTASGAVQWLSGGVPLCAAEGDQAHPQITSDGVGGAIVVWQDNRSGNSDFYAQRVNASGAAQWTADGIPLCTAPGDQLYPTIVSDGAGGAIVTWQDYRNGSSYDIYAQRLNVSGAVQWTTNGVALCTATGDQQSPMIVSDGAGGAIVTWVDCRSGDYQYDIYAQRVNASGAVQWAANGVALRTPTGSDFNPKITTDGAGGAIVAWEDFGNDIYAQLVSASGAVQWTANGVVLCAATGTKNFPTITSVGAGGAIVTWEDYRNGSDDIYVQRVNASGAVQWAIDGVALCTATGDQERPQVTADGAGGGIVAWEDHRCGYLIYAQRIRASGEIVGTTLQNYSAALESASIRIGWALSETDKGARFSIFRALAPDWKYIELKGATITQDRLSFTFTDSGCLPGSTYKYRVEYEVEGTGSRILFETNAITMPALPVTLYQNHPNPFNPRTVIRFYLPETQEIFLDVYNVAGERVARLAGGRTEKGYHEVTWDGRSSSGTVCSSGVYFSRLKAGKSTVSRKMVIMR